MKYWALALFSSIALVACSSSPEYRQAEDNGFGYKESQLSDTQYRVHFKAKGSDTEKAMDFAMLRAAELTLQNDYDWFTVCSRETLVDKEQTQNTSQVGFTRRYEQVRECGILSCRTTTRPSTSYETGVFVGGNRDSEVEAIMSIKFGKGEQPDSESTFDASEVHENLKPKAEGS